MTRSWSWLAVLLAVPSFLPQPRAAAAHTVPAKFDSGTGLFLVPLRINGASFWCNLDSGFSALLALNEQYAERAGLTPGPAGPTPDGRPATRGDLEARGRVDLADLTIPDRQVILRKFPSEAPDMDCVIGAAVFRDYVVEFDYEKPEARLYARERFAPASDATAIPLTVRRNTAFVEAALQFGDGHARPASMVVDTGASYFGVALASGFVERNGIASITRTARLPSAGALQLLSARVEEIAVGPRKAHGLVAALLEASPGGAIDDGLLGSGFLRQFTVAIDFDGAHLFLTPNRNFGAPQPFDARSVAFRRESGSYKAAAVIPDSPAGRAGIQPGDSLITVNGLPAERIAPVKLIDLLSEPGTAVKLGMRRESGQMDVVLALTARL